MTGAVVAQKLLANNVECADYVSCTLPTIEHGASEIKGAGIIGSYNMTSAYNLGEMTASFTGRNFTKQISHFVVNGVIEIELRFGESVYSTDGIYDEGTKIFIRGQLAKFETGKIENNTPREQSFDINVIRYREVVAGVETLLIDKLASVYKVNGVDILSGITALL